MYLNNQNIHDKENRRIDLLYNQPSNNQAPPIANQAKCIIYARIATLSTFYKNAGLPAGAGETIVVWIWKKF